MSEIMQFIEATFKPGVLVFVLANMVTLGLQAKIGDVVDTFKTLYGALCLGRHSPT
jgi:hypothetical protein